MTRIYITSPLRLPAPEEFVHGGITFRDDLLFFLPDPVHLFIFVLCLPLNLDIIARFQVQIAEEEVLRWNESNVGWLPRSRLRGIERGGAVLFGRSINILRFWRRRRQSLDAREIRWRRSRRQWTNINMMFLIVVIRIVTLVVGGNIVIIPFPFE